MTQRAERLLRLLRGLHAATAEGRARWECADSAATWVLVTEKAITTVSGPPAVSRSPGSNVEHSVTVQDHQGRVLEAFEAGGIRKREVLLRMLATEGELEPDLTTDERETIEASLKELIALLPPHEPPVNERAEEAVDSVLRELGVDDASPA